MDLLQHLDRVRIPTPSDRIFLECCISFDTPKSEGGLYVDMYSFLAFGKEYVLWNYEKNKNPVYLHIEKTVACIVVLPDFVTCSLAESPEKVRLSANAILFGDKTGNNHAVENAADVFSFAELSKCSLNVNCWDCLNWVDFLTDYSIRPFPGICSEWINMSEMDTYKADHPWLSVHQITSIWNKDPKLHYIYSDIVRERKFQLHQFCRDNQLLYPVESIKDLLEVWLEKNHEYEGVEYMKRVDSIKFNMKHMSGELHEELEAERKRRNDAIDDAIQVELQHRQKNPTIDFKYSSIADLFELAAESERKSTEAAEKKANEAAEKKAAEKKANEAAE